MTGRKRALHAWVALLLASSSATALEVQTGSEDFTLQVDPLIQPRIQVDFDGPPGGAAPSGGALETVKPPFVCARIHLCKYWLELSDTCLQSIRQLLVTNRTKVDVRGTN